MFHTGGSLSPPLFVEAVDACCGRGDCIVSTENYVKYARARETNYAVLRNWLQVSLVDGDLLTKAGSNRT
jgi:hypothetical protein